MTKSPEETMRVAENFARRLTRGDIIRLEGDLGAGKTTFVKGLAKGLGIEDTNRVKSPTFVIMQIYRTPVPLYHFDLYRLESLEEAEAIGFEDFIFSPQAITCVEWAEKAGELFPQQAYRVVLTVRPDRSRDLYVEEPGS